MRSPLCPVVRLEPAFLSSEADDIDQNQTVYDNDSDAETEMDPIPEIDNEAGAVAYISDREGDSGANTPTDGAIMRRKDSGEASILGLSRPVSNISEGSDDSRKSRLSWVEQDETKPIPWGLSSPVHSPRQPLDRRRSSTARLGGSLGNSAGPSSSTSSPTRDALAMPSTPKSSSSTDLQSKSQQFTLTPPPPFPLPLPPLTPASVISRLSIPQDGSPTDEFGVGIGGSTLAGRSRVSLDVVPSSAAGRSDPSLPIRESMERLRTAHSNLLMLSQTQASKSPMGGFGMPLPATPPSPTEDRNAATTAAVNADDADNDSDIDFHSAHGDDDDEITVDTHEHAEISGYVTAKRAPVDYTLRSTPGVVGLGEGWAGGPQPKHKRKWFGRRKSSLPVSDDPLALWTIDENHAAAAGPSGSNQNGSARNSPNPLKAMWTKSTRSLFGASTSSLASGSKDADSLGGGSGSERRRLSAMGRAKSLFSRSKLNLSLLDMNELQDQRQAPNRSTKSKRNSLAIFARRQHPLAADKAAGRKSAPNLLQSFSPSSRSQPTFFPEPRSPRTSIGLSRESFARSDTNLTIPRRSSSLDTKAMTAPIPQGPWRTTMDVPAPVIEEEEEEKEGQSPKSQPKRLSLPRTSTFGQSGFDEARRPSEQHPFLARPVAFTTPVQRQLESFKGPHGTPRDMTVDDLPDVHRQIMPDPLPPKVETPVPSIHEERRPSLMGKLRTALSRRPSVGNSKRPQARPISGMSFTSFTRPGSRMFDADATPRTEGAPTLASPVPSWVPRPIATPARTAPSTPKPQEASLQTGAVEFERDMVVVDIPATPTATDSEGPDETIVTPAQAVSLGAMHPPAARSEPSVSANSYDVSQRVVETMISLPGRSDSTSVQSSSRKSVSWIAALSTENLAKRLSKLDEEPAMATDDGVKGSKKRSLRSRMGLKGKKKDSNANIVRRASAVGTVFPRPPSAADVHSAINSGPQWSYSASASMTALDRLGSLELGDRGLKMDDVLSGRFRSSTDGEDGDASSRDETTESTTTTGTTTTSRHARRLSVPVNVDNLASSSSESLTKEALGIIDFPLPPALTKIPGGRDMEEMEQLASDSEDVFTSPRQTQAKIIHVNLTSSFNKYATTSPRPMDLPTLKEEEPRPSMDSMQDTTSESDSLSIEGGEVEHAVLMVPRKASYIGVESLGTPIIDLSPMSHMVATMAD